MRTPPNIAGTFTITAAGLHLRVKVVPGASRTRIVGVLGDRLKVAVSAAPEGGKANRAVCELIGKVIGVPARDVSILTGQTNPLKTLEIRGVSMAALVERLGRVLT
ncbi:MAG: DUF167 domain-containing protein [Phycisphaeraceae bacterium]